MATLMPALGACVSRMTAVERRRHTHDMQSLCERSRSKQFSFKSVGIQAQGRTTILKINSRNTKQILQTASLNAADLLTAAHREGHAWGDMAVICRRYDEMDKCAQALSRWQLPHQVRKGSGSFNPLEAPCTPARGWNFRWWR